MMTPQEEADALSLYLTAMSQSGGTMSQIDMIMKTSPAGLQAIAAPTPAQQALQSVAVRSPQIYADLQTALNDHNAVPGTGQARSQVVVSKLQDAFNAFSNLFAAVHSVASWGAPPDHPNENSLKFLAH